MPPRRQLLCGLVVASLPVGAAGGVDWAYAAKEQSPNRAAPMATFHCIRFMVLVLLASLSGPISLNFFVLNACRRAVHEERRGLLGKG
jgi:hypothetical protein